MKGYKIYFDTNDMIFKYEDHMTEVLSTKEDSTDSWNCSKEDAAIAVSDLNSRLDEVRICRDCKKPFFMTRSEQKWFTQRDLSIPVRCCACRKRKSQ